MGLDAARGMDVWIDMYHAVRRLARDGTFVLLTDDAAGNPEEESLAHLAANLGAAADLETVVPFLTCKHAVGYCRLFARRAAGLGVAGVAVVGGRPLRRARTMRPRTARTCARSCGANSPGSRSEGGRTRTGTRSSRPASSPRTTSPRTSSSPRSSRTTRSAGWSASAPSWTAWAWDVPVVYGVFLYRSANPRTLRQLSRYFPVPAREIAAEFAAGMSADEICARSVRRLREAGAEKVYVSNLYGRDAARRLGRVAGARR